MNGSVDLLRKCQWSLPAKSHIPGTAVLTLWRGFVKSVAVKSGFQWRQLADQKPWRNKTPTTILQSSKLLLYGPERRPTGKSSFRQIKGSRQSDKRGERQREDWVCYSSHATIKASILYLLTQWLWKCFVKMSLVTCVSPLSWECAAFI